MPPKVDKAKQAQKEKLAVDKTFGLKNKNKSKVVQKYIKSINLNAKGSSGKQEDAERKEKTDKEKSVQKAALMNSLFNMATDKKGRAFDPVAKKQAKQAEEEALAAGKKLKEEVRKEIIEGIANTIRLTNPKGLRMSELGGHPIIHTLKEKHQDTWKVLSLLLFIKANSKVFWVDDPDSTNPSIRCQEDVDAEIEPDERPIEEIIEEKRRALPPGGTPVTPESFKAWKEKREQQRLAQLEERRKEMAKKTGGKGLAALSGKDLFHFDASLFVDDDGAASADEYDEREEGSYEENNPKGDDDSDEEQDEDEDGDGEKDASDKDEYDRESHEIAKGSQDVKDSSVAVSGQSMAINKALFLEGGDVPDDLDDLDDLDDDDDDNQGGAASSTKD